MEWGEKWGRVVSRVELLCVCVGRGGCLVVDPGVAPFVATFVVACFNFFMTFAKKCECQNIRKKS